MGKYGQARTGADRAAVLYSGPLGRRYYTHVYAVGTEFAPVVKFGRAADVAARLSSLQTGSPVRLTLLASAFLPQDFEKLIHGHVAEHRSHGEWFHVCPDVTAVVDLLSPGREADLALHLNALQYVPPDVLAALPRQSPPIPIRGAAEFTMKYLRERRGR